MPQLLRRRRWLVAASAIALVGLLVGLALVLPGSSPALSRSPATPATGPIHTPGPGTTPAATVRPEETSAPAAPPTATPTAQGAPDVLTFLVVGLDRRSAGDPGRTDAIMLIGVDLSARRAGIVSIPRDLVVDIPGYGQDRINVAYPYGELAGKSGGGADLLRRTVERNFHVTVQHYAALDFACFRSVVDALGGITVDVPTRIVDPFYPTDDGQGTRLVVFEPGEQTLDGERALEYARTRSQDNDFYRIRRQQDVVAALWHKLLQPATITALPAFVPTITSGCRGMVSDLSASDWVRLALLAADRNDVQVTARAVDEHYVQGHVTPAGASVLLGDWERIDQLVRETLPGTVRPR